MTERDVLLISIELARIENDLGSWLESDAADAHRRKALQHLRNLRASIRAMSAAMNEDAAHV